MFWSCRGINKVTLVPAFVCEALHLGKVILTKATFIGLWPLSRLHSGATDRICQQTTNPCLAFAKTKTKSPHILLLALVIPLAARPPLPSRPVTQPGHTYSTLTGLHGEAWCLVLATRLSPLSAPNRGGRISVPPNHFENALLSLSLSHHTSSFVLPPEWWSTICCGEWTVSTRGMRHCV